MSDEIPFGIRQTLDKMRAAKVAEDFATLDTHQIVCFSDKDLAEWQSQQQPGTPQYIIADHEWQRRLTIQQVRAAYRTAWIGVIGTLLGTLLGATIGWWLATFSPIK